MLPRAWTRCFYHEEREHVENEKRKEGTPQLFPDRGPDEAFQQVLRIQGRNPKDQNGREADN